MAERGVDDTAMAHRHHHRTIVVGLDALQPRDHPLVELTQGLTTGRKGPIAFQMHNKGLFDEYVNVAIEPNPANFKLLTTGDDAK